MVRPSADELEKLHTVALWIRETLEEHGYLVSEAVSLHPAFSSTRRPSSTFARELVIDGARKGASIAGLNPQDESGGLTLESLDDRVRRQYRVKRARRDAEGRYDMICGLGSSILSEEPDSLFIEERWVVGYTMSDEHVVEEIFAGEIVDRWGDGPVHLVLGQIIPLSAPPTPPGFNSTDDDDLPGFDDNQGDAADGNID
jgi:hypothetical protein